MGRVLVVGGGIGGLATAIALRRAGVDTAVFERAGELKEIGAGITLWANAIRVLERLGLGEPLKHRGYRAAGGALRDWRGNVLMPMDGKLFQREYAVPSVALHRAELQGMLVEALGDGTLGLGHECVGVGQTADKAVVRFAGGGVEEGDLLVGADGIHSVVREGLLGRDEPRYAGYVAWRGVAEMDAQKVTPGETWGPGQRFGIVPIAAGRVYWFATANCPRGTRRGADEKAEVLRRFGQWHAPIRELIERSSEAGILRNDIVDRPPAKSWGRGRVTLLGDAAHPTTPNLGQGACMAIEDAEEIAASVREFGVAEKALREYERRRMGRTARLVRESRRIGWLGQWENVVACGVRNWLVKRMPAEGQVKRMGWLLGYDRGGKG